MTSEQLAGLTGIVLQLLFEYLPGVSGWYDGLTVQVKRLTMAGLMLVVAASVYGLSCYTVWTSVTCDSVGIQTLISAFIAALVANQGAHLVFKKS